LKYTLRNVVFSVSAALLAAGCGGANHQNEHLADQVTKAIIANDMRSVEKEFNAMVRPKLENRASVGRLSDELNALGKFEGVHETTPQGSEGGKHTFAAKFEKATWVEDMTLDQDGKIAAFHVHRPQSLSHSSSEQTSD
jgi:hypothetical protein